MSLRLIRFAGEDIGLADSLALEIGAAFYHACRFNGMPERSVDLARCAELKRRWEEGK